MDIFATIFSTDGLITALLLLLIVAVYWYFSRPANIFDKLGIEGPKPHFLFGQAPNLKKGMETLDMESVPKYGKIFGMRVGPMNLIVLADPDLIRQVFVKDTEHFTNRFVFDIGEDIFLQAVSLLKGEHWKRTRSILTPTFSASKMKRMMPLLNRCTKPLVENALEIAKKGTKFETKDLYGKFTMDVIATTMFGLEIDCQRGEEESEFVTRAKNAFGAFTGDSWKMMIIMFAPKLISVFKMLGIHVMDPKIIPFFVRTTNEVIELRRQGGGKYHDFIQLMLNAHKDEEFIDQNKDSDQVNGNKTVTKGLTDKEILAQSLIFFLAGYETTASLLSWTSYCLAANPDVQDKLREEIKDKMGDKEEISYDDVHELPYLDMVINETLRTHPPIARFDRELSTDGYDLGGYKLPAGIDIQVAVYYMHHNEEWWDEPFVFRPERFSAEEKAGRNPYIFVPFGIGPRNCIGMRFALVEAKAAIVAVLRKVKFTLAPGMPKKITYLQEDGYKLRSGGFHYPEKGIWLNAEEYSG